MNQSPGTDPSPEVAQTASHPDATGSSEPPLSPAQAKPELLCWIQEDCGCSHIQWLSQGGPSWSKVKRRIVVEALSTKVLASHEFNQVVNQKSSLFPLPSHSGHVITKFLHSDARIPDVPTSGTGETCWFPNQHQCRQLEAQVKAYHEVLAHQSSKKCLVQDVFSPPRFAKIALERF